MPLSRIVSKQELIFFASFHSLTQSFSIFYEMDVKYLHLRIIHFFNEVLDISHAIRKAVNDFYIAFSKKVPDFLALYSFRLKFQEVFFWLCFDRLQSYGKIIDNLFSHFTNVIIFLRTKVLLSSRDKLIIFSCGYLYRRLWLLIGLIMFYFPRFSVIIVKFEPFIISRVS